MKYLIFLMLACCSTKSQISEKTDIDLYHPPEQLISAVYRDSLHALPFDFETNRRGLEIFTRNFDKIDSTLCDIALKDFLEFQKKLLDELNQRLYNNPNFDTINTLIWADTSLHAPAALKLQQQLKQQGLIFRSTEGTIYLDADTEPIRTAFYTYLSESTQVFFDQYEMEANQGFAEDGGMLISTAELADRLGFWEEYLMKYPNPVFKDFALENIKYYRYYLMVGMDNTPAFDFESHKLLTEFEKALHYYQDRFGRTQSAPIFQRYLELIAQNANKSGVAVDKFTDQYRPWNDD